MDIPCIFLIYSIYIPNIFPSYVPYIFPCVFLNLWSQEKKSPYRKTTFLLLFLQILHLLYFFIKINDFLSKISPRWAPPRTEPQPGLGPNPDWAPPRPGLCLNYVFNDKFISFVQSYVFINKINCL